MHQYLLCTPTVHLYCSVAVLCTTPILSAMTRTSCGHGTQVGWVTIQKGDGVGGEQQLMQQEMGRLPHTITSGLGQQFQTLLSL